MFKRGPRIVELLHANISSPSRQEIDLSHVWLRSLDIGIPSLRNLHRVSRFKFVGWFMFFVSSIPIHLLFNSAIFETTFLASDWHLTIATAAFTQGATFFPPGSSLALAGAPSPDYTYYNATLGIDEHITGYGQGVDLKDYWSSSSEPHRQLFSTSREAQSWVTLTSEECQKEYRSCSPRKKYDSVVVIVDSGTTDQRGWRRSQVFHFDPVT